MKPIYMLISAAMIAAAVYFFLPSNVEQNPTAVAASATTESGTVPATDQSTTSYAKAAVISRKDDGHYWTNASVGGTSVEFMIDTGASIIALTPRDAQRIGIDMDALSYDGRINTAGGQIKGAYITLDEVRIGRVKIKDVDAVVLPDGLTQSLLGMSFLGQLYSYEFRQNQLIIRQ